MVQNEKDAYFRALEQQRQAHEELRAVHSACERREETLTVSMHGGLWKILISRLTISL